MDNRKQLIAMTKTFLFILLFLSFGTTKSQTLSRQVISAFGGAYNNDIYWSYTGGQPVYTTTDSTTVILTQGFEQPDTKRQIMYEEILPECDNGTGIGILVDVEEMCGAFNSEILLDDQPVDALILNVQPGTYSLEVICGGINTHITEIVIEDLGLPSCNLVFYSGFAPNGSFENQVWFIENVDLFPENQVDVFDRWGNIVWSGTHYDNTEVVWKGDNKDGEKLPQATYYFIFKAGTVTYKGFIELIR